MTNDFVNGWNAGAVATVVVPLIIFLVASVLSGRRYDGGGQQDRRWWWQREGGWWSREGGENDGRGMIIFTYLYMLIMFGLLIWYGNRILRHRGASGSSFLGFGSGSGVSRTPLMIATSVFIAMTFLVMLLVARFGFDEAGGGEEGGKWISQFSSLVVLTLLGMLLFLSIHNYMLQDREGGDVLDEFGNSKRSWWKFGSRNSSSTGSPRRTTRDRDNVGGTYA